MCNVCNYNNSWYNDTCERTCEPSSPKLWLKVCRKIKLQIIFHSTLRSRCVVSLRHVSAWDKDCQWGLGVSVQEQERQEGSRYTINLNCSVSDNLGQTSARLEFFCKKVNLRAGDRLTLPYRGGTRRWAHWTTHRISGRRKRLRIRSRENLTLELNRRPSTSLQTTSSGLYVDQRDLQSTTNSLTSKLCYVLQCPPGNVVSIYVTAMWLSANQVSIFKAMRNITNLREKRELLSNWSNCIL